MNRLLFFRKGERIAIIILFLIIIICLVLKFYRNRHPKEQVNRADFELAIQEYERYKDLEKKRDKNHQKKTFKKFNPNKSSVQQLIDAGIPTHIAKNIVSYRDKGAIYKNKDDLKRLYTVTDSIFKELYPYITIRQQDLPNKRQVRSVIKVKKENLNNTLFQAPKIEKFPVGTCINLNKADSITLIRIPQIGSYRAQKIIRYRNRLRGFYSIEQLAEIDLEPQQYKEWFEVLPSDIEKVNINKLSFKELLKHPYLNYEQVKSIFDIKRKEGDLISLNQLRLLEEFTDDDLTRLQYYFVTQSPIN